MKINSYDEGNESYKHLLAKKVIMEWWEKGSDDRVGQFHSRPNRSSIFEEYPICIDKNGNYIGWERNWDEISCARDRAIDNGALYWDEIDAFGQIQNPEQFLQRLNLLPTDDICNHYCEGTCGNYDSFAPTYDQCKLLFNVQPIAIIDVVVPHKGSPNIGIEICHKHPTSPEKIEKLRQAGVDNLIEINADWILSQRKDTIPKFIPHKRLI